MISEPPSVRRHLFYVLLNSDEKMTQKVPSGISNASSWASWGMVGLGGLLQIPLSPAAWFANLLQIGGV